MVQMASLYTGRNRMRTVRADFIDLLGKKVRIQAYKSYSKAPTLTHVEGFIESIDKCKICIVRTDIPKAINSDYQQRICFNYVDFMRQDGYTLTPLM